MARIKVTVSPTWTIHEHTLVMNIDDEEMEGMDDQERRDYIAEVAEDRVRELCAWDWEEVDG